MGLEVCSLVYSQRSPPQQSSAHAITCPEPPTLREGEPRQHRGVVARVPKTNCTEPGLTMPII